MPTPVLSIVPSPAAFDPRLALRSRPSVFVLLAALAVALLVPASAVATSDPDEPARPAQVPATMWKALNSAVLQTKLLPIPDGFGGDLDSFGASISASGGKVLIGGPVIQSTGGALIFEEVALGWRLEAVLTPSDADRFDNFGASVSLDGNRALIGANGEDDGGSFAGAAYVFEFDGTTWNETAKLTANVPMINALFGAAVSLDGDRALIGAPASILDDTQTGSAYVFEFDGTNWSQSALLAAPDGAAEDRFGTSASLDGDRVLIGARFDDDRGTNSGSALVFDFDGTDWNYTTKLLASDGAAFDTFGSAVSLSGNDALVGAPSKAGANTNEGAAYLFSFNGTSWTESEN